MRESQLQQEDPMDRYKVRGHGAPARAKCLPAPQAALGASSSPSVPS